MFISPSDTEEFINFQKSVLIMPEDDYLRTSNGPAHVVPTGSSSVGQQSGRYQDLLDSNPYRNLHYNQSGWQSFLSQLGFRTGYDDFREQAEINAREWDAGVMQMIQQNEYNSPLEQASRMREAGLNPDLQGLGDVADAANPSEDPNGMPSQSSELLSSSVLKSVGSCLLNIPAQVMGFMTNLSNLRGSMMDNDSKELAFGSSAVDLAQKFFLEGITPDNYKEAFEKNDFTNILDAALKDAKYLADTFLRSPRARKRFNLAYGMHSRSLAAEIQKYGSYDEFEKNRESLLRKRSSPFYSPDDETMEGLLGSILGPLGNLEKKLAEINLRKANLRRPDLEQGLENAKMSNQLEYENVIDPSLQATAENVSNEYMQQYNEIRKMTDDAFAEVMSNLKEKDNWWSKIAMALVGIARAQLLSGMSIQFGRHEYNSVSENDRGGYSTSQGSGFNFGIR